MPQTGLARGRPRPRPAAKSRQRSTPVIARTGHRSARGRPRSSSASLKAVLAQGRPSRVDEDTSPETGLARGRASLEAGLVAGRCAKGRRRSTGGEGRESARDPISLMSGATELDATPLTSGLASLDPISVTLDPIRLDLMPRIKEIESNEAGSKIIRSDIGEA